MPIFYSAVFTGPLTICDCFVLEGPDWNGMTKGLLCFHGAAINNGLTPRRFEAGEYVFAFWTVQTPGPFTFVCVTNASASIVAQHQFLEELSESWMVESHALFPGLGPQGFTHEGQLNEAYSPRLHALMEQVNGVAAESSRLAALQHMGKLRVEIPQDLDYMDLSTGKTAGGLSRMDTSRTGTLEICRMDTGRTHPSGHMSRMDTGRTHATGLMSRMDTGRTHATGLMSRMDTGRTTYANKGEGLNGLSGKLARLAAPRSPHLMRLDSSRGSSFRDRSSYAHGNSVPLPRLNSSKTQDGNFCANDMQKGIVGGHYRTPWPFKDERSPDFLEELLVVGGGGGRSQDGRGGRGSGRSSYDGGGFDLGDIAAALPQAMMLHRPSGGGGGGGSAPAVAVTSGARPPRPAGERRPRHSSGTPNFRPPVAPYHDAVVERLAIYDSAPGRTSQRSSYGGSQHLSDFSGEYGGSQRTSGAGSASVMPCGEGVSFAFAVRPSAVRDLSDPSKALRTPLLHLDLAADASSQERAAGSALDAWAYVTNPFHRISCIPEGELEGTSPLPVGSLNLGSPVHPHFSRQASTPKVAYISPQGSGGARGKRDSFRTASAVEAEQPDPVFRPEDMRRLVEDPSMIRLLQ